MCLRPAPAHILTAHGKKKNRDPFSFVPPQQACRNRQRRVGIPWSPPPAHWVHWFRPRPSASVVSASGFSSALTTKEIMPTPQIECLEHFGLRHACQPVSHLIWKHRAVFSQNYQDQSEHQELSGQNPWQGFRQTPPPVNRWGQRMKTPPAPQQPAKRRFFNIKPRLGVSSTLAQVAVRQGNTAPSPGHEHFQPVLAHTRNSR